MRALCFLPKATIQSRNDLSVLIRTAGVEFVACESEEDVFARVQASDPNSRSVLITDQDQVSLVQRFSAAYPASLIILTLTQDLHKMHPDLKNCLPIKCFVAYNNNEFESNDIITMFRKFRTRDIFGLDKYMRNDTDITSYIVTDSNDKAKAIERIGDFIRYLGGESASTRFEQYSRRISEMMDELILNAVFDANPRLRGSPRDEEFKLAPAEYVKLKWGFDGTVFGLSVEDQFGGLDKETVLKYIDNTFQQEDVMSRASGGFGLRFIFDRLHHCILNVHQDFVTEVVCLLRFERRMKDFDSRVRSFHYFSI